MAHTSDRTLLASLGFADPDKKDRRHTLACQYLCQPEVALRLIARVRPEMMNPLPEREVIYSRSLEVHVGDQSPKYPTFGGAEVEVPILKDRGYLIGFWDVVVRVNTQTPAYERSGEYTTESWDYHNGRLWVSRVGPRDNDFAESTWACRAMRSFTVPGIDKRPEPVRRDKPAGYVHKPTFYPSSCMIRIEVKAQPVDPADIARQLALYMQYSGGSTHVVATCYKMAPADRATLAAKGVQHIWLGDGFQAYCRERENEKADDEGGL